MKKLFHGLMGMLIADLLMLALASCSTQNKISKSARLLLNSGAMANAHVGISIFEPATNKYWYDYQGDHFFVPASNTKIPTCYAAMKYLGDSLVGLRWGRPEELGLRENTIVIEPTGDPSFLYPDFTRQPVFDFLKTLKQANTRVGVLLDSPVVERWGDGWSWNDYDAAYMAERSSFPVFGNIVTVHLNETAERNASNEDLLAGKKLKLFKTGIRYFDSIVNDIPFLQTASRKQFNDPVQRIRITRSIEANRFGVEKSSDAFLTTSIPFVTGGSLTALAILDDTLHFFPALENVLAVKESGTKLFWKGPDLEPREVTISSWQEIHSQPTDSLLKPMMHRSDNFFAEQSLLMVSDRLTGSMDDERVIDSLLKNDFAALPQKPSWVDGSGLSRYNLFSPRDLVFILDKMKNDFGLNRIKTIFPTGNEGTLSGYYEKDSGFIFAKTGSLSGVLSISGFLYTRKNKLLVFSTLVNNHHGSPASIRRSVEKFLESIRQRF